MFASKRFSQCQGTQVLFSTTCPSGNSPAKGRVGFELGGLEPMPLAGAEATRRVPSANPLWAVPVSAPTEADDSCVFTASAAVASAAAPVGAYGPRKVVDSIGWVTGNGNSDHSLWSRLVCRTAADNSNLFRWMKPVAAGRMCCAGVGRGRYKNKQAMCESYEALLEKSEAQPADSDGHDKG
jgi:hypothetical protein